MDRSIGVCLFIFAVVVIGFPRGVSAELPEGIQNTQEPTSEPPSPEESLNFIQVPDGFSVSLFAGEPDVAQPIAMEFDDRGRLWVAESFSYIEWARKGQDRILIFEDTDGDGAFDKRKVFWDKGNHLSGFQIGHGGVWICDAPELLFLPDKDRDDVPDSEPEVVLDGWAQDAEHNFFNGLTWGPDGWLWGRHGIKKPSFVGKPGAGKEQRVELSCSIWKVHPVSHAFEIVADGTVNPWGLDWNGDGQPFITTSVVDHFWHLVPGARFERWENRGMTHPDPFTYRQMEPASDHRHWYGGEKERRTYSVEGHDEAGGGHSHCGLVIYQSESWPEEYRGKAFFSNVLGQRINMDHIERRHSSYNAGHGEDFLVSSNEWFRAVDLKQGPYGEMMIAEWTDLGECHDRDGIHRTSGRIYEVWYGDRSEKRIFDVATLAMAELCDLLDHENVWWRRHALRNLYERAEKGARAEASLVEELLAVVKGENVRNAVTAASALHALKRDEQWIPATYAQTQSEEVRAYLVGLLFSGEECSPEHVAWLESRAWDESEPMILLAMASALQKIPMEDRWSIAATLSSKDIDEEDVNLILMIWYGIEPCVPFEPGKSIQLALGNVPSFLAEAITRRLIAAEESELIFESLLDGSSTENMLPVLHGLLLAFRGAETMPANWQAVFEKLEAHPDPDVRNAAFELALRFGDETVEKEMARRLTSGGYSFSEKVRFLRMLAEADSAVLRDDLWTLTEDPVLGIEAIRLIPAFADKESGKRLVASLADADSVEEKEAILQALASRRDFAHLLIDRLIDGTVEKSDVPVYIRRQLATVASKGKAEALVELLNVDNGDEEGKEDLIALWKDRLNESSIVDADIANGKVVYDRLCGVCHKMYGEGGVIGPDLTGSNRANLDYFLLNVLFPSEDVGEDYRLVTLTLKDGRTLVGNIIEENDRVLVFREISQITRFDQADVKSRDVSDVSLMPPGLLDTIPIDEVRDLVAYLRTASPPISE